MKNIKNFLKELKRVRWPSIKKSNKTFINVLIFVLISSIALFIVSLGMTFLWNAWGVGING